MQVKRREVPGLFVRLTDVCVSLELNADAARVVRHRLKARYGYERLNLALVEVDEVLDYLLEGNVLPEVTLEVVRHALADVAYIDLDDIHT